MYPEQDDPNEARVRELFERTAQAPSAVELARLRARAAEVPERARHKRLWQKPMLWAPGLAALAAIGVLWMNRVQDGSNPEIALSPNVPRVAASAWGRASASAGEHLDTVDLGDLPAAALDELSPSYAGIGSESGWDDIGLTDGYDALLGPPPEADLDAWLQATNDLANDDGG
jgi:hypothetical protein